MHVGCRWKLTGKLMLEADCESIQVEDAPAQLPVLALSATALQALKVERKGGQRMADDIDFPLPAHGHVEVAKVGILNKWHAGPVVLAELDCLLQHVAECPLMSCQ